MVSEDREATVGAGAPLGETDKHQQRVTHRRRACKHVQRITDDKFVANEVPTRDRTKASPRGVKKSTLQTPAASSSRQALYNF